MIDNNPTNVDAAYDILLEQIEAEIELVNRIGSRAFEAAQYDHARAALARVEQLTAHRDKIASLRKDWQLLSPPNQEEHDDPAARAERRDLGRLRRGLRTPEHAYYRPILEALVQLGGSANMNDVLERVHKAMQSSLKQVDYQPLASDPETLRWRNTAQWARNELVNNHLLKPRSRRGIWEISDQGRASLAQPASPTPSPRTTPLPSPRQATIPTHVPTSLTSRPGPPQSPQSTRKSRTIPRQRRTPTRSSLGLHTPRKAFYIPILKALVQLGGSAPIGDVLDRVHTLMKANFHPKDYEALPSSPDSVRWSTSARFARQDLIENHFLKRGSPYGIWEITEEGRRHLTQTQRQS